MDTEHIIRLENGEDVALSPLSLDELYKLHFEEESYASKIIRELEPFSKSREDYFIKAYDNINKIKGAIQAIKKETICKPKNSTFKLIKKVVGKIKKKEITVLELGCGNGTILSLLSSIKNLKLYGCDIQKTESICNATFYNTTIYKALKKFNDDSIDIIIADNVCEHFLEDEANEIYNLITKKLNKNGYCIFIIPNILVGPADISKRFIPYKAKPLGFHYMEQTYSDNTKLFKQHHLKTAYISIHIPFRGKQHILIKNLLNIPDKIKIWSEKIIDKLLTRASKNTRRYVFSLCGYNFYILTHK